MVDAMLAADYERLGAIDQAIVHYRRAVQIDPRDEASRAALQRLQGQPPGAGIPPRN